MRGNGREQNSIAIMTCRREISWQRRWSENRQVVGRTRTQSGPNFMDTHLADRGRHIGGGLVQPLNGVGIHALVEASLFHGRAQDDASIAARNDVHLWSADNVLNERPRAMRSWLWHHTDHLSFHRASGHAE